VIVTVEVPALPATMLGLVAINRKPWLPTTRVAVDEAYVESPEYVAVITCEPLADETKSKVAEAFESASEEFAFVPSTRIFNVPVGVVVTEPEPEATVIVILSSAPMAGDALAADSVVLDAVDVEPAPAGHAFKSLWKSIDPKPEAKSYPVPAEYLVSPDPEQSVEPAAEQLLLPLAMSWNAAA
jgi:hypothetical protein